MRELQVQEGFSEENPVMREEQEGGPPIVEHGLPVGEDGPSVEE
jgi:hypothetical protein